MREFYIKSITDYIYKQIDKLHHNDDIEDLIELTDTIDYINTIDNIELKGLYDQFFN